VDCVEGFDGVGKPCPWEPSAGHDRKGGCLANSVARAMSPNLRVRTMTEGHCIYVGDHLHPMISAAYTHGPSDLHGGNEGSAEGGCTPLPCCWCVGN
jgi:hypothetical protein